MSGIALGGNDWFGIGEGHKARHVEGCGAKPICQTSSDSCQDQHKTFNECVANEQQLKMMQLNSINNRSAQESDTKRRNFIIGAIVIVVIILIFKKK